MLHDGGAINSAMTDTARSPQTDTAHTDLISSLHNPVNKNSLSPDRGRYLHIIGPARGRWIVYTNDFKHYLGLKGTVSPRSTGHGSFRRNSVTKKKCLHDKVILPLLLHK